MIWASASPPTFQLLHFPPLEYSAPVEMIIRAHDAYSLGCCVDGIADVLALAQQWVGKLMAGKEYQLMVSVCVCVCWGGGGTCYCKVLWLLHQLVLTTRM